MTGLLRLSTVATLGLFAALVYLSYGRLMAGGETVFDDQFMGYSAAHARAYLGGLTEAQTQLYLGLFRWLDTGLPICVALTLGLFIWSRAEPVAVPLRVLMAASPMVYTVLDLLENALVAGLLRAGASAQDAAIKQASAVTSGKFITLGLAVFVALGAWRMGQREGRGA